MIDEMINYKVINIRMSEASITANGGARVVKGTEERGTADP